MIIRLLSSVFLACVLMFFCLFAHAEKVETVTVFTTSFLVIEASTESVVVTQYFLDEPDVVMHELNRHLYGETDLDAAMLTATNLINTSGGQALIQRLESSFDGVVQAWSYKIEYLPAILINEQYLVYGVYSVDSALSLYRDRK